MEEIQQPRSNNGGGLKLLIQVLLLAPLLFFLFSFINTFELEGYSISARIIYAILLLVTYLIIWVLSTNKFTRFLVFLLGLYLIWLVIVQIAAPSFKSLGFENAKNMSALSYIPEPITKLYQSAYSWVANIF